MGDGWLWSIPQGRDRDISIASQADHLLTWLRHIGLNRIILAGHDLGGGVAQIAAVRNPGLCIGLFLTNAIGYDSWPIPSVKLMRTAGPLIRHLPNSIFKQIFRSFLRRGHTDSEKAEEALKIHWQPYAQHKGATAFIHQVNSLNVQNTLAVAEKLPQLGAPARIAWGAADQFQNVKYGERFARDLDAPLHRIEAGRHFTPEDYPEVIAGEINQLISDVRQSASAKPSGSEGKSRRQPRRMRAKP
jgi:pimeloyl-ACP methyl ester carboxylesterase